MDESKKRKAENKTDDANGRKPKKSKKQWRTPKKGQQQSTAPTILPGDSGIWATCAMHKEAKTTGELRDLFEDYAAKLYGEPISDTNDAANDGDDDDDDADNVDIETEISKELQGMKSASTKKKALFRAVRVDVQCLLFFKTRAPIEPVSFVHSICEDANNGQGAMGSRFAKRLTPMVRMGKASPAGLDEVARTVLGPVFHAEGAKGKKFAIRPTIRNNNTMKRDDMIRQIATIVGPGHMVDLKGYDVLILVDVYRNMLGMSVVGSDYEKLKRYNLAEIYEPTPKPDRPKNPEQNVVEMTLGSRNEEGGEEPTGRTMDGQQGDKTDEGVQSANIDGEKGLASMPSDSPKSANDQS